MLRTWSFQNTASRLREYWDWVNYQKVGSQNCLCINPLKINLISCFPSQNWTERNKNLMPRNHNQHCPDAGKGNITQLILRTSPQYFCDTLCTRFVECLSSMTRLAVRAAAAAATLRYGVNFTQITSIRYTAAAAARKERRQVELERHLQCSLTTATDDVSSSIILGLLT